jgi:hypothetical protein
MEELKAEGAHFGHTKFLASMRRFTSSKTSYLRQSVVYLSLLVPSYAQSYVGGDLSNQAPYGVPPRAFASAISSPSANTRFSIHGYDTSIPAGAIDATANHVNGWSIDIGVTANVPLTESSNANIDKNKCIDATTLSITPPNDIANCDPDSWRVCAIVFTGGLGSSVTKDVQATKSDGSCGPLLPEDCIQKLQAESVAAKAGKGSGCADLKVPDECADYFAGTDGTAYKISPVGGTAYSDRRSAFFAWGSKPTFKGNKTALNAAMKPVWPVLLTWSHFTGAGDVHDSAGWLSCVNTPSSKEVASGGSSTSTISGGGKTAVGGAVLLSAVLAGLAFV